MAILIPAALLFLLLPGLAFRSIAAHSLSGVESGARGDGPEQGLSEAAGVDAAASLADLFGLGFAMVALAGMLSFFLPGTAVILAAGGLAALAAWQWVRRRRHPSTAARTSWTELVPLLASAAVLLFRFYQARDLALPAWVDSVHHTLLVRLVLEHGGLPQNFEPVMPVPLIYHGGFHANAALFAFFSWLEPAQAVLVFGQILNAGVSLAVYRLGWALWGERKRALVAMLLSGFAFQMPAYYLTWGRYTLLAGALLLALAMAAALDVVRGGGGREPVARLAALSAGLFLTHYYAALVFVLFLGMLALNALLEDRSFFRTTPFREFAAGAGLGMLLALPWIAHVLAGAGDFIGLDVVAPGRSLDEAYYPGYLAYLGFLLGPFRSHVLHALGLAGLVILGWRRRVRPLALFTLLFGLLSLPWGVHLAPFRPDHGVILAFLPASLFAADALVSAVGARGTLFAARPVPLLFWAALAGLLAWGVLETRSIINPVTVLADGDDVSAIAWIEENTPASGVFFINTAPWQGGAYRGVDGGWWIGPLALRRTLLPPALYIDGGEAYARGVIELARRAAAVTTCDAAFWDLVEDGEITHLYLKAGAGSLQAGGLVGCEGVRQVYGRGGVGVYEVGGP